MLKRGCRMQDKVSHQYKISRIILHTLAKNLFIVIPLVFLVIGSILLSLLPPLALEKTVNSIVENDNFSIELGIIYFLTLLSSGLCDSIREVFLTLLGQKITRSVRLKMIAKLSLQENAYFAANSSGKIASYFINDVEALESLFKSGIISTFIDFGKIIGILAVVFTKSLGIGIIVTLISPLLIFITWKFKNKMKTAQLKNRQAIASVNAELNETINNFRTIKTLGKEEYFEHRFSNYVDQSYKALETNNFFEAIYTPLINQIAVFIVCLVLTLSALGGGWQTIFGIGVGSAVAIIDYVFNIFSPIENLGMEIQNVQASLAGLKRLDEFMAMPSRKIVHSKQNLDFTKPAVEFENVTFGYEENKNVLSGVSFSINTGETVSFAGRTGAGKSTSFKLIMGLEKPKTGEVYIYGIAASLISDEQKRHIFGYIEQNFRAVSGSILEQITLGGDYTFEEVVEAAKTVGLHETIMSFPKAYEEKFSSGVFSQGQMQLLSVARAIVAKPKILLLDEITANLDSNTESSVVSGILSAAKGRTLISITHRLNNKIASMCVIKIGENAKN